MEKSYSFIADKGEAKRRQRICNNCEHLSKRGKICTKCGCFTLAKVRLEGAKCPIGKW